MLARRRAPGTDIISVVQSAATQKLPENVEVMVLDSSGDLREDVSPEELPGYLSDKDALVWCDISGTENGPYGRLLKETFGFEELMVEDCFIENHLPKVDDYGTYLFMGHLGPREHS